MGNTLIKEMLLNPKVRDNSDKIADIANRFMISFVTTMSLEASPTRSILVSGLLRNLMSDVRDIETDTIRNTIVPGVETTLEEGCMAPFETEILMMIEIMSKEAYEHIVASAQSCLEESGEARFALHS
jgi:hypothetical protein